MNYLEKMRDELAEKQTMRESLGLDEFTLEEKIQYIYARMCEELAYDERYNYSNQALFDGVVKKTLLFNKTCNVTNVKDNKIVCTSGASLIADVLNGLFYKTDKDFGEAYAAGDQSHMHLKIELKDKVLKGEFTLGNPNDLTRSKLGMKPEGFKCIKSKKKPLEEENKEIADNWDKLGLFNKINFVEYLNEMKDDWFSKHTAQPVKHGYLHNLQLRDFMNFLNSNLSFTKMGLDEVEKTYDLAFDTMYGKDYTLEKIHLYNSKKLKDRLIVKVGNFPFESAFLISYDDKEKVKTKEIGTTYADYMIDKYKSSKR